MKTLSDEMKAEAIGFGLCKEWTNDWEDNSSKQSMVEKMIRGFDFCLKHNWPSLETMKREDDGVLAKNGIYVDDKNIDLLNPGRVIINGDSEADIYVDSGMCEIDVRHTSKLKIKASRAARVWVNLHDYAEADATGEGLAKVFVHTYGDNAVTVKGNVRVKDRKGFYSKELFER